MEITSVSRRYGGALYDFAREQDARDAVRADCTAILKLYESSSEFAGFVDDPTIPLNEAEKTLIALLEAQANPALLQFLRFLVSKRRLDQLPAVCKVYEQQICEELGILKVKVSAAHVLSDTQLTAMKEKLQARYNKQIDADVEVDPALIGGLKIQVGDHIRDFSLATKLDRFEQSVINAKHEHPKLEG
ncbi:ATP synthase F1 subunit delta [Pontiellaceae bacterium B12227]|nr:ATP synthase F1 subunit delta [Pontiellaceae bacterium B12227]